MRTGLLIVGFYAFGCNALVDPDEISAPRCVQDADCDDAIYCNGPERCDPVHAEADGFGCISTGPAQFLDDGIVCTVGRCDEETRTLTQDASDCTCEEDGACALRFDGPCVVSAICDEGNCVVGLAAMGTVCDDGVECTQATTCDAQGQCTGTLTHEACNDGLYCNGAESCAPANPMADPISGCLLGTRPAEEAGAQGCAEAVCDEETDDIIHVPTAQCECADPIDCGAPATCRAWRCDASTDFTCVDEQEDADASCDDGIACTVADGCTEEGLCAGRPSHALCDDNDVCNGQEMCASEGCVAGQAPEPLPEQCR